MVIVVIVVILPAGFGRGPRGGALDGGCTHKRVGAENNAAADRLTGRGMFRQRGIFDGLAEFVTLGRFSSARQGFIDVGEHGGGAVGEGDLLCNVEMSGAEARFSDLF